MVILAMSPDSSATDSEDFTQIPLLDYSVLQTDRPTFLAQLRHALVFVGFMYIKNLPVREELMEEVKRQTRAFFDLDEEEKMRIEMKNGPHFLGYSRQGNEITKSQKDNREQLDLGNEIPCTWSPSQPLYQRLWGPNQWPNPELLPGFRETFGEYMDVQARLSIEFTGLVAESLGVQEEGGFARFYDVPVEGMQHRLKIVKYPAVDQLAEGDGNQGVGRDTLPGLQVQNRRGDWVNASPLPGTFVVNIGKGLETVTQGVALATTHRVLNPPKGMGPRFSVPFFQNIGHESLLGDLTFKMPQEMLDLRDKRGTAVTDSGNYQELSKMKMGESTLINRIRAHPDVGKAHYPELYAELFPHEI